MKLRANKKITSRKTKDREKTAKHQDQQKTEKHHYITITTHQIQTTKHNKQADPEKIKTKKIVSQSI
jgi:hypothetical protein